MLGYFLLFIAGLIILWFGADIVVENAKKIARRFHVSQTLVGLTIVSIGTSLPEIFTNINAGLSTLSGVEASGLAVGTNIGSCLTQITLILGITALFGSLTAKKQVVFRDGVMVLLAILMMFFAAYDGVISRLEGALLIIAYLAYLTKVLYDEKVSEVIGYTEPAPLSRRSTFWAIMHLTSGIVLLIVGGELIVNNALSFATLLGIKQSTIGILIVGVGTGLPELTTALRGIFKDAGNLSLGTLIGSNITDPLLSLGSGAVISGFVVNSSIVFFDIVFWFFATLFALLLFLRYETISNKDQWQGASLIGVYFLFLFLKLS